MWYDVTFALDSKYFISSWNSGGLGESPNFYLIYVGAYPALQDKFPFLNSNGNADLIMEQHILERKKLLHFVGVIKLLHD